MENKTQRTGQNLYPIPSGRANDLHVSPNSSSPADQLALIGDRIERLQELSQPITASNGEQIHDQLCFFCGDKPAQQFERGNANWRHL